MPRAQTSTHILFRIIKKTGTKIERVECIYCYSDVANNGTRKKNHIKQCIKCPNEIKTKYLGSDAADGTAAKSNKNQKLTTNIMVVCDDSDLEEIFPKIATNSRVTSVITNDSDEEELAPIFSVGGLSRH